MIYDFSLEEILNASFDYASFVFLAFFLIAPIVYGCVYGTDIKNNLMEIAKCKRNKMQSKHQTDDKEQ